MKALEKFIGLWLVGMAFCGPVASAGIVYDSPPNGVRIAGPRAFGQTFIVPGTDAILADFTVRQVTGSATPTAFNFGPSGIIVGKDPVRRSGNRSRF